LLIWVGSLCVGLLCQLIGHSHISTLKLSSLALAVLPTNCIAGFHCPTADPLIQRLIDDPNTFLRTTQTLGAESASVQDITTQMTQRAKWRHTLQLHAILWPTLAGVLLLLGGGTWSYRRRRRRQQQLAQIASGRSEPAAAVAVGAVAGLFGTTLQQRSGRNAGATQQGQRAGQAAGGASQDPGWFYGDGFMHGSSAAAAGAADLSRMSVNSSDAADGMGRHGARNMGGTVRNLRWLLSSRIRFVLKMQGNCADAGFTCSSGDNSPVSTGSPVRSSCDASVADSMEQGVDDLSLRVVLAEDNALGGSPVLLTAGASSSSSSSIPQHGLCMHEESFATRLRAKQQQQLP
jgi:LPXTG-motif cell wall-anchored protein